MVEAGFSQIPVYILIYTNSSVYVSYVQYYENPYEKTYHKIPLDHGIPRFSMNYLSQRWSSKLKTWTDQKPSMQDWEAEARQTIDKMVNFLGPGDKASNQDMR